MNRDAIRRSFTLDDHNHFHVDKSLLFTDTDRRRHELCLRLLDTVKKSISSFKPSESLACLEELDASHPGVTDHNHYDFFVPESEHFADDAATSSSRPPRTEIDLVISGGGLKGYFMTGCSAVLKHELKKQNISIRRIAGASAGAWCGLFMLTDFSTANWLETYYLSQERLHLTMHESYNEIWPWIESHLPENAYEICSGRLFISVTEVTWCGFRNRIISEFSSNRDLFDACLASSTVPYISLPTAMMKFRDMWVIDGGVTDNTPIFKDLPRRVLVFRLSDVFYPFKLLVHPKDSCIEALVVRGAIQMSRFLQGEPSDSFSWIEYDGSSQKKTNSSSPSAITERGRGRSGEALARLANAAYFSLVAGGSAYTLLLLLQREGLVPASVDLPKPQELLRSFLALLPSWPVASSWLSRSPR